MKKKQKGRQQRIEIEPIFGDFFELESFCERLHDESKVANVPTDDPGYQKSDPLTWLRKRLDHQWSAQAREIEAEYPGLFPRTYLASIYDEADEMLERIERYPSVLPVDLPRLELLLHKLYILPLRNQEEVQQELGRAKSEQTAAASRVSHEGRAQMQIKANEIFLAAPKSWASLSAAAREIAPVILEMKVSRPLAKDNAKRTVTKWLSDLVKSDPTAAEKLTPAARSRLKHT